ncbi:MAG: LysR family transcriptional regulator [Atopobiaceae bacterium]
MYDRRLDAIVAAANLGSFSKAAQRLNISTPALVKQVSGFEAEHGLVLFVRSHSGVSLTEAGRLVVEGGQRIIRESEGVLARAKDAGQAGGTIRLGKSMMAPARQLLRMWQDVRRLEPGLKLEIVPVDDLYAPDSVMAHLGQEVDVLQSSYSTPRWGGSANLLRMLDVSFCVDVPYASPLASRREVKVDDLVGKRLCVFRNANDAMDDLRDDLESRGVRIRDVDRFDFSLFNQAEAKGDAAVLTCGAWSGIHPAFVGVPLSCGLRVPVFLAYPRNPRPEVQRFVSAVRSLVH